jgi:hypothetical protein
VRFANGGLAVTAFLTIPTMTPDCAEVPYSVGTIFLYVSGGPADDH